MTVVLVPSLRHQLLLLISIFPLLPKAQVEEEISRGKIAQKQKERRDLVTKDIRSFFRGSTIIKSSDPLNLKGSFTEGMPNSLKPRKTPWKKWNLEFRKWGIKDCEWYKNPEKYGIKKCEPIGPKSHSLIPHIFVAGHFSALLSPLKVWQNLREKTSCHVRRLKKRKKIIFTY